MDEQFFHACLGLCLLGSMCLSFIALALGTVAPYGRYSAVKSFDMNWGPPINGRVAWVVQELPSLVGPLVCLHRSGRPSGGNALLLALFLAHYVNRAVVYPLRIRRGKPTPLGVAAAAFGFTTANGYLQARALAASWARSVPVDALFVAGVALLCAGAAGNVWHDGVLRDLRRGGGGGYEIPRGGLFEYVSGANFLCEIVEWFGFAVAARTPAAWVFAASAALNIGPRGVHHHRWYLATFGADYPAGRRAIVPFLL